MNITRLSQRGQVPTSSPMSMVVFFLLYFTFIQVLIFLVEGIVPMYLTADVTFLAIGSGLTMVGVLLAANVMERSVSAIGSGVGGAPVSAWHLIHFGLLAVVETVIGIPLLRAVMQSAMFNVWLIAIFIVLPFIAFSIAMYSIIMGSGGA